MMDEATDGVDNLVRRVQPRQHQRRVDQLLLRHGGPTTWA